ncbi:MAG: ABC transporter permease subunit [Deltaproteobacteria bacterium]|nr:ABC transporter permease subunit [Deltaproteobacteria bacterium]
MGRYIIRRILGFFPTLFCVITVAFFIIRVAPGGPFDRDKKIPPKVLEAIEEKYHLDKPLYVQYVLYLKQIASFDLGPSYKYQEMSVNEIVGQGFPVSMQLGLVALFFSLMIGLGAGLIAAIRRNTFWDYGSMGFAMLGIAIPNFVIAPILILFFSLGLSIFPPGRWESWESVILPGFSLSLVHAAYIARLARAGMLDVLTEDFIRTARAKGLRERLVILRHALRGGITPAVSYLGPAAAAMLTGSIVVEKIFLIPGMGRYFVDAALNRDLTLVMGVVIVDAAVLLVFNLIVDILYGVLDPRVRYD